MLSQMEATQNGRVFVCCLVIMTELFMMFTGRCKFVHQWSEKLMVLSGTLEFVTVCEWNTQRKEKKMHRAGK